MHNRFKDSFTGKTSEYISMDAQPRVGELIAEPLVLGWGLGDPLKFYEVIQVFHTGAASATYIVRYSALFSQTNE